MAFQTNVFRDGEWVTETVNLHAVLKSQKAAPKGAAKQDPLKPPPCGLLTTTLVESARANSILPARIRSSNTQDVAFVGDHFVQLCELRRGGLLVEFARKSDFGCRIRSACVISSGAATKLDDEADDLSSHPAIKSEHGPEHHQPGPFGFASPRPRSTSNRLPPELLLLVLENGDHVLLFARRGADGRDKLVASRFGSPKSMPGHLGFHLALDPSSRYLALACPTDAFVVYELESREQLDGQYLRNEPLRPVRSFRLRTVRGAIHKMTFLYPSPGDHRHIILLLVIVRHGKSRTVIYNWELGSDLKTVFAEEQRGHRMPVEDQMPLLLIPLTVQSAFVVVSPDRIAICTGCLHGPPDFNHIPITTRAPTPNHRGRGPPLWTAWARPFRLDWYSERSDSIYLAREDGVVAFLEANEEADIKQTLTMKPFSCNISAAFSCLFDDNTDVLVLGNDSGPGAYWKIPPRQPAERLGTLPNWSPVVDFTTTDDFTEWHPAEKDKKTMIPWQQATHRKPDRIFATCEGGTDGGIKGSITEYRYGLKATIALDLEYGAGIRQAWLLPLCNPPSFEGYLLFLSMPDLTAGLQVPSDFSSATPVDPGTIPYDLSSTTLALVASGHLMIQITRKNIVLATQQASRSFPFRDLPGLWSASVSDVCALDNCIAVSTHTDSRFQIHVLKVDPDRLTLNKVQVIDVDGEITCLSLGADGTIWAGVRNGSLTLLARASLQEPIAGIEMISLTEYLPEEDEGMGLQPPSLVKTIDSIVAVRDTVLMGTRSGEVITAKYTAGSVSVDCEKFGTMPASVSCSYQDGVTHPTILVCCDNSLVSVSLDQHGSRRDDTVRLKTKTRVWPVDISRPDATPPPVQVAKALDMPPEDGTIPILMVSGSRLLLAEMNEQPGPVHRSIPVDGSPNKLIYCQFTQCLVAAVNRPSGPTLAFINPDTGEDMGRPTDKNDAPLVCIPGLGTEGDRIMCLAEWNYRKPSQVGQASQVWNYLLVTTRSGRLIVITADKVAAQPGGPTTAIRYSFRFKKEVREPIYSVVGHGDCLAYCAGQTIHWEVLGADRRLKPLKSFPISSPATSLRISHSKLVALTANDSLLVLDNRDTAEQETKLRHVDPWRRNGVDAIEVAGPRLDDPKHCVHLVADRERGVAGLWVPWQSQDRECEVVLEAELPASVRRFARGRTRPLWEQRLRKPRYGRLPATVDDAEVLGVSLDGSLRQFSLLGVEAWRVLRFVQNLARGSLERLGDGESEQQRQPAGDEDPEPRLAHGSEMHVDGDLLRRCLEERALEQLVVRQPHVSRFVELLGALDDGQHTAGLAAEGDHGRYFQLAYDVLEYYLAPAF